MKKVFFVIIGLLILTSCGPTVDDLNSEVGKLSKRIDQMKGENANLELMVRNSVEKLRNLEAQDAELNDKISTKQHIVNGGKLRYIVELELSQSHFSLSISQHLADVANIISFELPVDKEFYDAVSPGKSIVNDFRGGSFLLKGSVGNWNVVVKNKRIEKV